MRLIPADSEGKHYAYPTANCTGCSTGLERIQVHL